jgi:malate dehydrogenase
MHNRRKLDLSRRRKIAIIGAGNVGESCALFCAKRELGDIFLMDIDPDMPRGKALDIMKGGAIEFYDVTISGTNRFQDLAGADVVIVSAGAARKPGMSRSDLTVTNTKIIRGVATNIREYLPDAFVIVVTNPLDVMCWVAKEVTGFPRERIVGMAGALDSARFCAFIAMELDVSVKDVHALVMGGHGDTMVPLTRYASVSGIPVTELLPGEKIDRLVERTRNAGAEMVSLLKTGSAYVSPAASAVMMAEAYLKDQKRVMGVSAYLEGEYGISGIYLGVPVKLSGEGVSEIIELPLTKREQEMLFASADAVRKEIEKIKS